MSIDVDARSLHPDPRSSPIRVLVVDDHPGVRTGLAELLAAEPDLAVVGDCEDGSQVEAAFDRLEPDVVLMDISMPVMDGLTATRRLLREHPDARVAVLTARSSEFRSAAVDAGARAFLSKNAPPEVLVACIRSIAEGRDCCLDGFGT